MHEESLTPIGCPRLGVVVTITGNKNIQDLQIYTKAAEQNRFGVSATAKRNKSKRRTEIVQPLGRSVIPPINTLYLLSNYRGLVGPEGLEPPTRPL